MTHHAILFNLVLLKVILQHCMQSTSHLTMSSILADIYGIRTSLSFWTFFPLPFTAKWRILGFCKVRFPFLLVIHNICNSLLNSGREFHLIFECYGYLNQLPFPPIFHIISNCLLAIQRRWSRDGYITNS